MNGKELLKSAGLSNDAILSEIEGVRMEWNKAMITPGGYYSPAYVEEKLRKIRAWFQELDDEKDRLQRISKEATQ